MKNKLGLDEQVVKNISYQKNELSWVREFRLRAYQIFLKKTLPEWAKRADDFGFQDIKYYVNSGSSQKKTWDEVPKEIKDTFEKLGVPKAEREVLAGVKAQYESEVVYGSLLAPLEKQGVIFLSMDEGIKLYPEIVKKYFGKLIPPHDNKFAALNSAVFSGGSFLYVPKNVRVELPLQAYFRINEEKMGQFERTLIIAEEGSFVHYTEGCTAPLYSSVSLHSAVVEIYVGKGAHVIYSTIQNWSTNVFNLVTKRARVEEEGRMEWIDGNLGSRLTMKYPSVYLVGRKASGEILSLARAKRGQVQDSGGKAIHLASETKSRIIAKSISMDGGTSIYRGQVKIPQFAENCRNLTSCDALILDDQSISDTFPTIQIQNSSAQIEHEATASKISRDELFYANQRGLPEDQAKSMILNGFLSPIVRRLPMEYAVELNRLIELDMSNSVG
jgi:Fe-S cluster assembly protein SufB